MLYKFKDKDDFNKLLKHVKDDILHGGHFS